MSREVEMRQCSMMKQGCKSLVGYWSFTSWQHLSSDHTRMATPTCDSAHSWQLNSAGPRGYQVVAVIT